MGFGIYLVVNLFNNSSAAGLILPAFIAAFGGNGIFMGFLGCCGAFTENRCMLITVSAS